MENKKLSQDEFNKEIERLQQEHLDKQEKFDALRNRYTKRTPPTAAELEYFEQLHKSKGFDADVLCRSILQEGKAKRPPSHRYSYEDGRKVSWACTKSIYPDYKVDSDFLKGLFPALINYFLEFDGRLDHRKGLLFTGGVGLGKTSLFRIFQRFAYKLDLDTRFKIKTMMSAVYDVSENSNVSAMKGLFKGNICFDDLGQEAATVKLFGNEIRVFEEIMTHRYNNFITFGHKTHLSTNLTFSQIKVKYGDRVSSRILEMMNIVPFRGVDRRANS
jgi:DNA replication protein DnaC